MPRLPGLDELSKSLRPPPEGSALRVLVLEVGDASGFGAGRLQVNPWLPAARSPLPWPLDADTVEDLASRGLPLSLWAALQAGLAGEAQLAALAYLHALAASDAACDQLLQQVELPLSLRQPGAKAAAVLGDIERALKRRLGFALPSDGKFKDWTRNAAAYEVWLGRAGGGAPTKVRVRGGSRTQSAFDLDGSLLTGGRVWAGSLLLMRWIASLEAERAACLGAGPVLELGSGIGIVGIALAKMGRRVVLSDREPMLLEQIQENIEANHVKDRCRVLKFDWADAGKPQLRRALASQRFTAVVGADVVYEEETARLIAGVLRRALPQGGVAVFANGHKFRRGIEAFRPTLVEAGFEVTSTTIPVGDVLQRLVCGDFEPEQEYSMCVARVPPEEICVN